MASSTITPVPANDNAAPRLVNLSTPVVSFGQRKALRDLPTYLKAGAL